MSSISIEHCSRIIGEQNKFGGMVLLKEAWFNIKGRGMDVDVLKWWSNHEEELPQWSQVCKNVLLLQPSSAATERVFSILESSFNKKQTHSLQDYNYMCICNATI